MNTMYINTPCYPIDSDSMVLIGIRFEEGDAEAIRRVAKARGETMTSFVRRSVRRSLARMGVIEVDDIGRKALELEPKHPGGN
jgi:hypothetical protein